MINFLNKQPQSQRDYYTKLAHILGISQQLSLKVSNKMEDLNEDQMFEFCRFNDSAEYSSTLQKKISTYLQPSTGNTCLHVAGEYGNINLIKYILKNELIKTNNQNKNQDSPLFHTLKYSKHQNFQKTVLLLSKYTDLSQKDKDDKYAYEVDLQVFTKSRVRILQAIRQDFFARLGQK